jgi:Fic family protein
MTTTTHEFSPFVPGEKALEASQLPDKAVRLATASAKLSGNLADETRNTIRRYIAVINSYYSNLIEGNKTRPHEIRAAQKGEFSKDPAKRDLQQESVSHIQLQNWIADQAIDQDVLYSPDFFKSIHRKFYQGIPENLWLLKDQQGEVKGKVVPGEWRTELVDVGQHVPPKPEDLGSLMQQFCNVYHPKRHSGDKKFIAAMCAHHRFVWIHPFADGNGRVARLFTDEALKSIGLESYGVWCLSRGLARSSDQYKTLLARADNTRQGDHDGRGALSEKHLLNFCDFMLDTAIDQIDYISDLLQLNEIHKRIDSYIQARNDERVSGVKGKLKEAAGLILYNAFVKGELERSLAYELSGMPERSARRLLGQLKDDGLLSETSAKSPLKWEIPEHAEPWYFPNLTPGV